MSYGYEPPKQESSGSWAEVFAITRVVFELLMPFLAAILGIAVLLVVTILLIGLQPWLGFIPVVLLAAGIYWVLRRERLKAEADAARIRGD